MVAHVASGDSLTTRDRQAIDTAIRSAEIACRYEFSVYVGAAGEQPGAFARRLHAALVAPTKSVMMVVDPSARVLEIVTGAEARRELTDEEVQLTVAEMKTVFAEGDLSSGIVRGIAMLAQHATN